MTTPKRIGIVGLGLMGGALAERLIGAVGFDIDAEKLRSLEKIGGAAAACPADVARQCDVVFLAVFNTEQVEDVVERHLLPAIGAGSGKILLCASTCDPDRIAALAQRIAPKGFYLLHTPISEPVSRSGRAREWRWSVGRQTSLPMSRTSSVRPYFHMGRAGNAGRTKLAINLILGLNRLPLAEGLVFAERMGLEPGRFLDVARQAASYSQVMDTKGPKMVRGDFAPELIRSHARRYPCWPGALRSNQRPDTFVQDRSASSTKPLATHGRTIHVGHH